MAVKWSPMAGTSMQAGDLLWIGAEHLCHHVNVSIRSLSSFRHVTLITHIITIQILSSPVIYRGSWIILPYRNDNGKRAEDLGH